MKKNLLLVLCLFLVMSGKAFSAEIKNQPQEMEVRQKACQNVFSLINIDLSLMSPRAAVADVSVPDPKVANNKKDSIVPISNKTETKQPTEISKNRTSLFRIDLFHIFKIQIL